MTKILCSPGYGFPFIPYAPASCKVLESGTRGLPDRINQAANALRQAVTITVTTTIHFVQKMFGLKTHISFGSLLAIDNRQRRVGGLPR
jgi:hypothetical protein